MSPSAFESSEVFAWTDPANEFIGLSNQLFLRVEVQHRVRSTKKSAVLDRCGAAVGSVFEMCCDDRRRGPRRLPTPSSRTFSQRALVSVARSRKSQTLSTTSDTTRSMNPSPSRSPVRRRWSPCCHGRGPPGAAHVGEHPPMSRMSSPPPVPRGLVRRTDSHRVWSIRPVIVNRPDSPNRRLPV